MTAKHRDLVDFSMAVLLSRSVRFHVPSSKTLLQTAVRGIVDCRPSSNALRTLLLVGILHLAVLGPVSIIAPLFAADAGCCGAECCCAPEASSEPASGCDDQCAINSAKDAMPATPVQRAGNARVSVGPASAEERGIEAPASPDCHQSSAICLSGRTLLTRISILRV